MAAHPKNVRSLIFRLGVRPRILRFRRRYHSQIEFLVRRFQPEGAFGLSFTVGVAFLVVSKMSAHQRSEADNLKDQATEAIQDQADKLVDAAKQKAGSIIKSRT